MRGPLGLTGGAAKTRGCTFHSVMCFSRLPCLWFPVRQCWCVHSFPQLGVATLFFFFSTVFTRKAYQKKRMVLYDGLANNVPMSETSVLTLVGTMFMFWKGFFSDGVRTHTETFIYDLLYRNRRLGECKMACTIRCAPLCTSASSGTTALIDN